MSNIPALLTELENAINAVEPRVLQGFNLGLSDAEINARMAKFNYVLPDDLRALYRWRGGSCDSSYSFIPWWSLLPLAPDDEESEIYRRALRDDWERREKTLTTDLEAAHFLTLFEDGGGELLASCYSEPRAQSEIHQCEMGAFGFDLMFEGVESMIQTALECWRSGVFWSSDWSSEHRYGWELEVDDDKYTEIGRRLNSSCSYWFE